MGDKELYETLDKINKDYISELECINDALYHERKIYEDKLEEYRKKCEIYENRIKEIQKDHEDSLIEIEKEWDDREAESEDIKKELIQERLQRRKIEEMYTIAINEKNNIISRQQDLINEKVITKNKSVIDSIIELFI